MSLCARFVEVSWSVGACRGGWLGELGLIVGAGDGAVMILRVEKLGSDNGVMDRCGHLQTKYLSNVDA